MKQTTFAICELVFFFEILSRRAFDISKDFIFDWNLKKEKKTMRWMMFTGDVENQMAQLKRNIFSEKNLPDFNQQCQQL